jgi:hypothetical protein
MSDLQPLYDLLGEAFKAGMAYVEALENSEYDRGAASILFPLAARTEEEVQKFIEEEREACARYVESYSDILATEEEKGVIQDVAVMILGRTLPSYPERET